MIPSRFIRFAWPVIVAAGLGPVPAHEPERLDVDPELEQVPVDEDMPSVPLPVTVPRRVPRVIALTGTDAAKGAEPTPRALPDPLRGTPAIRPETTGIDAAKVFDTLLPGRSDAPFDWYAPVEPLHLPGEPRALSPCVPPPPCHPSEPPHPYDLVGLDGWPSCGPIYGGPCAPRTGTPHHGPLAWYHRLHDRFFDRFYKWK